MPDDDQGEFNVNVRLPRGTSYPRTEEFIKPIEKEILALPALRRVQQSASTRAAPTSTSSMIAARRAEHLAAGHDAPRARACCASTRARASACPGGTDISGASTAAAAAAAAAAVAAAAAAATA